MDVLGKCCKKKTIRVLGRGWKGPKVCGGVIGGAAGARISRPIIVIRLESKLINKTKVILLEFVWPLLNIPYYIFWVGLVYMAWFSLVWLF